MNKPTLGDIGFDSAALSKYELDLARGIAKATDPEDHKRMMQAIKLMAKASPASQPSAAPEGVGVNTANAGLTLTELVSKLFTMKATLSDATRTDYTATAKEFSDFLKGPLLVDITESDVTRYMEALAARKNSPRTIDKKVGAIRAIFNFAKKQKLFKGTNPAEDRNLLTRKQKKAAGSKAFDLADLQTLFANPHFANYRNTEPAFYWVTVAGLITGVRVSALAALDKKAFKISPDGAHYIYIEDDKTAAGRRPVPIPKEFFVPFFQFITGAGGFGFAVRPDGKGASDPIRKLLNAHKTAIKYVGEKQTFHSFRKTLNTYMMHNKVPIEARCQIMGHEIAHVNVDIYATEYSVEELAEMVVPLQKKLLQLIQF